MRPFKSRVVNVLATFIVLASLAPAGSEAGLLDCLWGGGAGGQAQTTYTPRYVAPAVYYPSSSAEPAGPFARLRAALRPTPFSSATACYCVPQVCYRQVVQPIAVTSYTPVVARDACTGCPVTVYQPVTTWSNQVRLVPYTTYRMVCTRAQYVPAVCATRSYSVYQQPGAYLSAPAVGGSCTSCVPTTAYMPAVSNLPNAAYTSVTTTGPTTTYMPAMTGGVGSASGSYPAAYPGPTVQPGSVTAPGGASSTGIPSSNGGTTGAGAAAGSEGDGKSGSISTSGPGNGKAGNVAPGAPAPYGGSPGGTPAGLQSTPQGGKPIGTSGGAASSGRWGIAPGGTLGGGTAGSTSGGAHGGGSSSGGTTGGGTSHGLPYNYGLPSSSGTGWPSRWGGIPLPGQIQQPSGRPTQQLPPRSAPVENTEPQPAPAGPALTDPGDKTALLPPLVARSAEPVRGRLVPVERLQIPEHNNNQIFEQRSAYGAWSIVRN